MKAIKPNLTLCIVVVAQFFIAENSYSDASGDTADIEIDLMETERLGTIEVVWDGYPVRVVRRTDSEIALVSMLYSQSHDAFLGSDVCFKGICESETPDINSMYRSYRVRYFVTISINPVNGCHLNFSQEAQVLTTHSMTMRSFTDPCDGTNFDLAGRSLLGRPVPIKMIIPPHRFESDNKLIIGDGNGISK